MTKSRSRVHFNDEVKSQEIPDGERSEEEFKGRMFKFDYVKLGWDLDLKLHGFKVITTREGLSRSILTQQPLTSKLNRFKCLYRFGAGWKNFYVGIAKPSVHVDQTPIQRACFVLNENGQVWICDQWQDYCRNLKDEDVIETIYYESTGEIEWRINS